MVCTSRSGGLVCAEAGAAIKITIAETRNARTLFIFFLPREPRIFYFKTPCEATIELQVTLRQTEFLAQTWQSTSTPPPIGTPPEPRLTLRSPDSRLRSVKPYG